MPKRTDLKSILIIGAGPIIIGQACEFDYSGVQACKALREEGYKVILINSNPATIMTDPATADVIYIEPITWQTVEKIIVKERPDAILPTMGGQTALNCALDLWRNGVLDKYKVELIGATPEAILSPIILSEMQLRVKLQDQPETVGLYEALLVIAGREVATDPTIQGDVATTASDAAVLSLLKKEVQVRYQQLLTNNITLSPSPSGSVDEPIETLGPLSSWQARLQDRVGELFDRFLDAPKRAAALPALELFRDGLHRNISQFLGDVFVYINERGDVTHPGPIISTVLQALRNTPKQRDEPLLVITHSLGSVIFYDIVTHFAKDLHVDVWVSVGGQVGQFEEMKLFKSSDKNIVLPNKVGGLKPQIGFWLNIYDPIDVLSFKTEPVFLDADEDVVFLTGADAFKSHTAYFKRATFYEMLLEHLQGVL